MSRRDQILLSGYELAGKNGLEGIHARTIAAEIGINHAAVHYYFKTRVDLFVALIGYSQKRFDADLARVREDQTTSSGRLEAHIALYEAYARPASRFFRVVTSMFVAAVGEDRLKTALQNLVQHQQSCIAEDIKNAKAAGVVRDVPMSDPVVLLDYLYGICLHSQMVGAKDPTDQIDRLLGELIER